MSDVSKTSELIAEAAGRLRKYYEAGEMIHMASSYRTGDGVTHIIDFEDLRTVVEAATRVPVQGEPECECWPTEEKYHFVHFGATEPGSAFEYNPECPEHGEPNDDREALIKALGEDAWEGHEGVLDLEQLDLIAGTVIDAGFSRAALPVQPAPSDEAVENARAFLESVLTESEADVAEGGGGWDVEVDARTVLEILDEPRAAVPDAATEGDYLEGLEEGIKIELAERDAATELHPLPENGCDKQAHDTMNRNINRVFENNMSLVNELEAMKAERDAALAAVERVRAIHGPSDEFPAGCDYCERLTPCSTRVALDGAPEPEWEYRARLEHKDIPGIHHFSKKRPFTEEEMSNPGQFGECGTYWAEDGRLVNQERRTPAGPWLPIEKEQSA